MTKQPFTPHQPPCVGTQAREKTRGRRPFLEADAALVRRVSYSHQQSPPNITKFITQAFNFQFRIGERKYINVVQVSRHGKRTSVFIIERGICHYRVISVEDWQGRRSTDGYSDNQRTWFLVPSPTVEFL